MAFQMSFPTTALVLNETRLASGAIYTYDSAYESPYDSVYDFLHKVVRGCLHVRFCVRIAIRLVERFASQGLPLVNLLFVFAEMCSQSIVVSVR
jgi:hypothetical protein